MGNWDQIKGKTEQTREQTADNANDAPGLDDLQGQGAADDIKGKAEDTFGNARRKVGNALDDLGRKIKGQDGGRAMKAMLTAVCLAAVASLGTSAQAQQSGTSDTGTFTLTGCLDRANDGTYELKNARPSTATSDVKPGAPAPQAGATGTTGAADASKTAGNNTSSSWILKSTTDLAPHVGHSVQITGRMSSPAGTGGSDTATTSAPTTTATGARMKKPGEDAKSVDVQAVRMISRSCPQSVGTIP